MSDEKDMSEVKRPRKRVRQRPRGRSRRHGRIGFWMVLNLMLVVGMLGYAGMSVSGRALSAPRWLTNVVADRANEALSNGRVHVGAVQLQVNERGIPRIHLRNLGFFDARGSEVVRLNDVAARLSMSNLLQGELRADVVRLSGAQMTIRRREDGQFSLSFGSGSGATGSLAGVLDAFDRAFTQSPLNAIAKIEAKDLTISLEDARSGRIWQITEGNLAVTQIDQGLDIAVNFEVFNGTEELAETVVGIQTDANSSAAAFGVSFKNAAAEDIALQSPVLSFLGVLEAPISGALRADFAEDGALADLAGTLEIGAGALRPTNATEPANFSSGKSYFHYDPNDQKLVFSEVSVASDVFSVIGSGHAYLKDFTAGWPSTMLAQIAVSHLNIDARDLFVQPVTYAQGAADLRVRLDPFSIELGQMVLKDGEEVISAKGSALAGPKGWELAADIDIPEVSHARLLAVWPPTVIPKTRLWLDTNVRDAKFANVHFAARVKPDQPAVTNLGFRFKDASIRFIKTLPPIENAAGYSTLSGPAFSMVLEKGAVSAPLGGKIDVAGTTLKIPDVSQRPATAEFSIFGESRSTATLSLLNEPPFNVLRKTQLPVDIAEGLVKWNTVVSFPMITPLALADVSYRATGNLFDMTSDKLVKGRILAADKLALLATPDGVEISGPATIGSVKTNMAWRQIKGADGTAQSEITGTVNLSKTFIDEFSIGLPANSFSGEGSGDFNILFIKDQAPAFTLKSDLQGIGLSIRPIGWSKSKRSKGSLDVAGSLGAHPRVSYLALSAPGLKAAGGSVSFKENGGLGSARFSRVQAGNWLDAPVTLTGRGANATPAISVSGGTVDIRKTTFATGSGAASARSTPMNLTLDRVTVSQGISLTNFNGKFENSSGFAGTFNARVNGGTRVIGRLAPSRNGVSVRIQSEDAGGVFKNAGVLKNASGGFLDMTLQPLAENGFYRGDLTVKNTSIKNAPALTELLNSMSIVGLLDQMKGTGISFADVEANFTLGPNQVQLHRSSATGPSLGVSLDGVYDLVNSRMNMQGVISPVYFLNGIGQLVSPRRGEGLFGFNFRLSGTADDPRVQVNPLSILTPGIFRDIFRRPAPKVSQ